MIIITAFVAMPANKTLNPLKKANENGKYARFSLLMTYKTIISINTTSNTKRTIDGNSMNQAEFA